jgi:predicted RNase H-like nuclease
MMTVFVGFDSAWADNPRSPGAICAVEFDGAAFKNFNLPRLVNFAQAAAFIEQVRRPDCATIVAVDQPTIVPNKDGMRPVDRVAASVISWMGGGVQPANRNKKDFFGDGAAIWGFLDRIGATQDPEASRTAAVGTHAIEVFPALALASLHHGFFGRLKGPRYNPTRRKTFRVEHWRAVVEAVRSEAVLRGIDDMAMWLADELPKDSPGKRHQDMLDSAICLLVAIRWRVGHRGESVMIGDTVTGYMVAPVSDEVRERLALSARERRAPMDGKMLDTGASSLAGVATKLSAL